MQEKRTEKGQQVFETICKMFDDIGYRYDRRDDDHVIVCRVQGEDIPMEFFFFVRDEREIVKLVSPIPFTVPEDKRVDIALATTFLNNRFIDGNFDFDLGTGKIYFRLTASFIESDLGKKLFDYMLSLSTAIVDDYNDKFLMISKGMVSVQQFIESESK